MPASLTSSSMTSSARAMSTLLNRRTCRHRSSSATSPHSSCAARARRTALAHLVFSCIWHIAERHAGGWIDANDSISFAGSRRGIHRAHGRDGSCSHCQRSTRASCSTTAPRGSSARRTVNTGDDARRGPRGAGAGAGGGDGRWCHADARARARAAHGQVFGSRAQAAICALCRRRARRATCALAAVSPNRRTPKAPPPSGRR